MRNSTLLHKIESTSPYRWLKFRLNADLIKFFDRHVLAGHQGLQLAELACGSGYGAHLLARHPAVARSVAVDMNRWLHDQANIPGFAAEFIEADLFHLPFKENSFDFAWNSSSIEHFEDPVAAVRAMSSVVKKGGQVFVGVPYLWGPLAAYYLTPSRKWRGWLGRPFSFKSMETIFRQAGLNPTRRIVYFFGFFAGVLASKS